MSTNAWGFSIGRLHVTWWDAWAKRPCFEVVWVRRDCWERWEREVRRAG